MAKVEEYRAQNWYTWGEDEWLNCDEPLSDLLKTMEEDEPELAKAIFDALVVLGLARVYRGKTSTVTGNQDHYFESTKAMQKLAKKKLS